MSDCPLQDAKFMDMPEVEYCPFCGESATANYSAGVGRGTCDNCDKGFWVQL